MKVIVNLIMGMLLVAYPFVVFMGLQYLEPRWLAIFLLCIISIRLLLSKSLISKMPWLPIATGLGALLLLFSTTFNSELGILLYPVAINVAMFAAFGYSLYKKPSIIEGFARIREPDLDAQGVRYTEKVTFVWCVFFVLNGSVALYTSLYMSRDAWTFYNGFLSYVAMGLLFGIEYLIRCYVKRNK